LEARRVSVFFYGLFMDPELLRGKGLEPVNPRRARVPGMRLCIGNRAALEVDASGEVYGFLVDLTHAEIERLYAEPGVAVYRPEAVMAESDEGAPRAALCFNLPDAPDPHKRNPEYVLELRELAARLGLPDDYVRGIG
jgi:Gamma-glutamyl cyclotransferase, AIG2-like